MSKRGPAQGEDESSSSKKAKLASADVAVLLKAHVSCDSLPPFIQQRAGQDDATVKVTLRLLTDASTAVEWSKQHLNPAHCKLFGSSHDAMTAKTMKKSKLSSSKPTKNFWKEYVAIKACWLIIVDEEIVGVCACQCVSAIDKKCIPDGHLCKERGPAVRGNIANLIWIKRVEDSAAAGKYRGVMTHAVKHICQEIMKIDEIEGVLAVCEVQSRESSIKLALAAGLENLSGGDFDVKHSGLHRSFLKLKRPV